MTLNFEGPIMPILKNGKSTRPTPSIPFACFPASISRTNTGFGTAVHLPGSKIATFASILKHDLFPLPQLLSDLLDLGRKGMGCPVEIEFAVNLGTEDQRKNEFYFLQMRPMATEIDRRDVVITDDDLRQSLCFSRHALGNGKYDNISDIVYVKPQAFQINATEQMADEIGRINAVLSREKRPYLLIGPGRWGTCGQMAGHSGPVAEYLGRGRHYRTEEQPDSCRSFPGLPFFSEYHVARHSLYHGRGRFGRYPELETAGSPCLRSGNPAYPACPARSSANHQNSGQEIHWCHLRK